MCLTNEILVFSAGKNIHQTKMWHKIETKVEWRERQRDHSQICVCLYTCGMLPTHGGWRQDRLCVNRTFEYRACNSKLLFSDTERYVGPNDRTLTLHCFLFLINILVCSWYSSPHVFVHEVHSVHSLNGHCSSEFSLGSISRKHKRTF